MKADRYVSDLGQSFNRTLGDAGAAMMESGIPGASILGASIRLATGVLDIQNRDENIERTLEFLNNNEWIPRTVREGISDILGESSVTEHVYSLVKKVTAAVQRARSSYQDGTYKGILKAFKEKPKGDSWEAMRKSLAETDVGSLVHQVQGGATTVMEMLKDPSKLDRAIRDARNGLADNRIDKPDVLIDEAEQLAHYMVTGETGKNLSTNAAVIANKAGVQAYGPDLADILNKIDKYTTLVALKQADHTELLKQYETEPEGVLTLLETQAAVTRNEQTKHGIKPWQRAGIKGYHHRDSSGQLVRIHKEQRNNYYSRGYNEVERDGDYVYMVAGPNVIPGRQSGILQSTRSTVNGFDLRSRKLDTWNTIGFEPIIELPDGYVPVYDTDGKTLVGRMRAVPREITDKVKHERNYARSLGQQRGRQVEEVMVQQQNVGVLDALKKQYMTDAARGRTGEYVNILEPQDDPVLRDAISVLDMGLLKESNGDGEPIMVRKDQLKTVVGYRYASISDFWTGNSRWSPETQKTVQAIIETVLGPNARRYLSLIEANWKGLVSEAKHVIVVKSVAIGIINAASNIVHLMATGMAPIDILLSVRHFAKESRIHHQAETRLQEIQNERLTTFDPQKLNRLAAEEQALMHTIESLEIWPLIKEGELSGIVGNLVDSDIQDTLVGAAGAKFKEFRDNTGMLGKVLGNMAFTEDSTTYNWSRTFVDYGDFLAKAAVMRHWKNQGTYDHATLMSRVRSEFVNYSIPPGRWRHGLESFGAIWFWQFKLGSVMTALRRVTENPISSFLALNTSVGLDLPVGNLGIPMQDNLITQTIDGTIGYTMGLGMFESAVDKHPALWLPNLMARAY